MQQVQADGGIRARVDPLFVLRAQPAAMGKSAASKAPRAMRTVAFSQ
jgi:hypothetical protein